jgi:hypothetical protein
MPVLGHQVAREEYIALKKYRTQVPWVVELEHKITMFDKLYMQQDEAIDEEEHQKPKFIKWLVLTMHTLLFGM